MRKKERIIVASSLIITLALFLLAWFLLLPKVEAANQSYASLRGDITAYETSLTSLDQAKGLIDNAGTINGLPVKTELLFRALPKAEDQEDIYALVENMARQAQISQPVSMTVNQNRSNTNGIGQMPITISTAGSYENLISFVTAFQQSLRPVIINSLDLFPTEEGNINLSLTATAYVLADESTSDTAPVSDQTEVNALQARSQLNENL